MKHYIIFLFLQLIFTVGSGSSIDFSLFSSSLIGPYRMIFRQVYDCNPTQNNTMQFNVHLSQSYNKTLLVGNTTSDIPFDDTLSMEIKIALKDSFGIWKENVLMYKSPNACSTVKQLLGKAWPEIINGYGFPSVNCPILSGVYKFPGMDLQSICEKSNFPKVFMYGTYKFHIYYTRNNEIFGCQGFIVDIMHP